MTIKINFDGGTLLFADSVKMFEWMRLQRIPSGSLVTVTTPRGAIEIKLDGYRPPEREKREKKFVEYKG